jgi:putative nucleotidyltransferase with HDIG domain
MKWITNKNWQYLCQQYDWVADMHGIPQSPEHHAEGDVAIHTQMVLQALIKLPEYENLTEEAREIIWFAALMHDIEKRSTTFTEADGSIVSPGHAKKGAQTARQILFTQFDLPFSVREQIVHLVRYHGLPLWLMEKENPQKALLEASLQVNTQWLALLAKADMSGRICKDQIEMLERIEFFEAYCKEQNCWGKPYAFANGLSKYRYFHKEDCTPEYSPYDDTICEVVVMSGLPGMGKDNYIQTHYKDRPMVSLDGLRRLHKLKPEDKSANGWIAQQAKEQARIHLRAKQNFVWNATNITLQMRSQLIDLLTSYKARVKLVYVEQPYKVWQRQNADRLAMVPKNVLDKLLYKLEIPKLSEAHEVIFAV